MTETVVGIVLLRLATNPLPTTSGRIPLLTVLRPTHHHNLMIAAMWVSLKRMQHLPTLLTTTIPLNLQTSIVRMKKPMAVRMEGKETRKRYRRTLAVMGSSLTVTRSPTATTITQMAASSLCGLRSAPCTVHPSQGTFADAGCPASQGGLLSPVRNLGVKSPDILEGLFEKSFCSTKLVPQFLSS